MILNGREHSGKRQKKTVDYHFIPIIVAMIGKGENNK